MLCEQIGGLGHWLDARVERHVARLRQAREQCERERELSGC